MHIVSELFVAREAAARRYLGAWDEEAALEGSDDWFDEATDGGDDVEAPVDMLPDETADPPSPLDEAREALVAHDQRSDLDATHVSRLWDLLEDVKSSPVRDLERVTRHGSRTLFRLPVALVRALAAVQNADVDAIVQQWTGPGGFRTTTINAADILRSLRDLAKRTQGAGIGLYLLVLH